MMVLLAAGPTVDPIFGTLAQILASTHALWDAWMPQSMIRKRNTESSSL